jgi:Flp pilus assembly protein TadG
LKQKLIRFTGGQTGNVAITFALATLPVIGSVGAAVDYSRANKVEAQLQAALDSTALMLSKEAATDSPSQLQSSADRIFLALFSPAEGRDRKITASFSTDKGTALVVTGSAAVPTVFTAIIGVRTITVHGTSTAEWGSTKLRVALALDNTGSMQQNGKMAALKSATKNFLLQLKNGASTNGDIYVSVIPFATSVNLGSSNYTQSWLDWSEYGSCSGWGWGTSSAYTARRVRPRHHRRRPCQ